MSSPLAPPRWPTRLLIRLLGAGEFAESVVGDLTEEWATRVARNERFNTLWYWRETVAISIRMTSMPSMRAIGGDIGRGLRNATHHRLLLALSSLGIALGIASPTVVFSIVHGLSRDLPFPEGDRIVYVTQASPSTGDRDLGLTEPVLTALAHEQRSLEGIAAFSEQSVSLADGDGPPEHHESVRISPSAFSLLRVRTALGVAFTEDDARNGADVALISDALWAQRFGASPQVIGRVVRLNARPTRIIGVMPAGFRFPYKDDVWQPLVLRPGSGSHSVKAFGRLRAGVTAGAADLELAGIGARVVRDPSTPNQRVVTRVLPFKESQLEPSDLLLFRAMVLVVSTVLVVACANVANLFLAHVAARGPLFAVKSALGASRGAIVREMLAETALPSLLGGVGGVLLASAAIHAFNSSVSDALPAFWMAVAIDSSVLMFSTTLVAAATVAAGLVPALYASRADPAESLREQGARVSARGSARAMRVLLTLEIAVSCTLLAIAGIMTKGAIHGSHTDLGVDASKIVGARVYLDVLGDDSARTRFAAQIDARVGGGADPRLARLAFTTVLPGLSGASTRFAIGGQTYPRDAALPRTRLAIVSPSYFDVLKTQPHRGRLLDDGDVASHPRVAVVNETFAGNHFAAESPLGARIQIRDDADTSWVTIVGVVPDISTVSADSSTVELLIVPFAQRPAAQVSLLATGPADLRQVAQAVHDVVRSISPDVPVSDALRLTEAIARSRRASWSLASVFAECGFAGLILTAIGVYGVADTASRRRVHELAIRRALGSSTGHVVGLVIRESAIPLAIGLSVGTLATFVVAPLLSGLLFGESPHDPAIFGSVTILLCAVLVVAAGRPAIWVARMSLVDSLRRS